MRSRQAEAEKWAADTGQLCAECDVLFGTELTAYLSGADEPRQLSRLLDWNDPFAGPARDRLETARKIARLFSDDTKGNAGIRRWLRGLDQNLGFRAPATLIRESTHEQVLNAVFRHAARWPSRPAARSAEAGSGHRHLTQKRRRAVAEVSGRMR